MTEGGGVGQFLVKFAWRHFECPLSYLKSGIIYYKTKRPICLHSLNNKTQICTLVFNNLECNNRYDRKYKCNNSRKLVFSGPSKNAGRWFYFVCSLEINKRVLSISEGERASLVYGRKNWFRRKADKKISDICLLRLLLTSINLYRFLSNR